MTQAQTFVENSCYMLQDEHRTVPAIVKSICYATGIITLCLCDTFDTIDVTSPYASKFLKPCTVTDVSDYINGRLQELEMQKRQVEIALGQAEAEVGHYQREIIHWTAVLGNMRVP